MERCKKNKIQWLEFPLLQNVPGLVHGTFLRHGGVSQMPFDSLNVSIAQGDSLENVVANRKKIEEALGIEARGAVQCHGNHIAVVTDKTPREIPSCDGLITQERGKGLLIKHADCQAALFCDPITKTLLAIHAGWRGQVLDIYGKGVELLKRKFYVDPKNLLVCISPSLGPRHAEFIHYKKEFPEDFWPFQAQDNYFDLWEIANMQLMRAGVLPHHIQIAKLCTYEGEEDFFSYRRIKISGRLASVIGWSTNRC